MRQHPLRGEGTDLSTAAPSNSELIPCLAQPCAELRRAHQDSAARSGACALPAAEAKNRDVSDAPEAHSAQSSSRALRRILNDGYAMVSAQTPHSRDVGWIAVEVGYDDCVNAAADCAPH